MAALADVTADGVTQAAAHLAARSSRRTRRLASRHSWSNHPVQNDVDGSLILTRHFVNVSI